MRDDLFAGVLGVRRGLAADHSPAARRPTARARARAAELEALLRGPWSDPQAPWALRHTLHLLGAHPQPRERPGTDRPLLRALRFAAARRVGELAAAGWDRAARDWLHATGLRERDCHGLLVSPAGMLHVWPDAGNYGNLRFAQQQGHTPRMLCGQSPGPQAGWRAAPRGAWRDAPPGEPASAPPGAWRAAPPPHLKDTGRQLRRCRRCSKQVERMHEPPDDCAQTAQALLPGWLEPTALHNLGHELLPAVAARAARERADADCERLVAEQASATMPGWLAQAAMEVADDEREAWLMRLLGADAYTSARERQRDRSQLLYSALARERVFGLLARFAPAAAHAPACDRAKVAAAAMQLLDAGR